MSETQEKITQTLWESGDDNQKVLTWAYLAFALVFWFVLGRFFQFAIKLMFTYLWVDSSLALQVERFPINPGFILAGMLSLGLLLFVRFKNAKANQTGLEVVVEMKKVTWPARDVTMKSTVAVIITVFICAVILGLFDLIWGKFSSFLLQ